MKGKAPRSLSDHQGYTRDAGAIAKDEQRAAESGRPANAGGTRPQPIDADAEIDQLDATQMRM